VRVDADPPWYGVGVDTSIDVAAQLADYSGPGGWNDLDMLVVGLRGRGHIAGGGLSFLEYQTHMSLWVIACSPLMIGCDVRALDADTAALLTNVEVLAVNQDLLGVAGRRCATQGRVETWRKPLADGSVAVALVNRGSSPAEARLRSGDLGLLDKPKLLRDLWRGDDIGELCRERALRLVAHQTLLLRVSVC
jgi:alpha-galactosidase